MRYIGVDPGPTESGVAVWMDGKLGLHAVMPNGELLSRLRSVALTAMATETKLVVEMVAMAGFAGATVYQTCVTIGRLEEAWTAMRPLPYRRLFRKTVVAELTGSGKFGDPDVRKALVERIGTVGTKKAPGPLFGMAKHMWSALALAVVAEILDGRERAKAAS